MLGATCIYIADVRSSAGVAAVFCIYGVIYFTMRLCESPVQRFGDSAFRLIERVVPFPKRRPDSFYYYYYEQSKPERLHPLPPGWAWVRTADGQVVAGIVQEPEKETVAAE